MNKLCLIGNLGKDPEMSYTANGKAVTKFSLAVTRRHSKSASGERETDWFNIVAWTQLAETCSTYLKKGQKVYVEGRLEQRKYTDKEGVQRTVIDVVIHDMEMLTPRSQAVSSDDDDDLLKELDAMAELEREGNQA